MSDKIIITGGCGFIGSHTAVELIQRNYEVVLVDDLSNASVDTVEQIEKITGTRPSFSEVDLKDESATSQFFKTHQDAIGGHSFCCLQNILRVYLFYANVPCLSA